MSAVASRRSRATMGSLRRAADAAGYAAAFALDDAPRRRAPFDLRAQLASGAFLALAGCAAWFIVF
ncbi:MAG TPA: hypothetical protein VIL72_09900 [Beijerinckiaceae bacterium]